MEQTEFDFDARENHQIASLLREAADLYHAQDAQGWRVRAFRAAADRIDGLGTPAHLILEDGGLKALEGLPDIGPAIARAIEEMVRRGRWARLDRLRDHVDPADVFGVLPGIGPELAHRIHDHLHLDSLEALELAAHDGRLETVPGVGPRRAEAIRTGLEAHLRRVRRDHPLPTAQEPGVDLFLDIDREYRESAQRGLLPKINTRRFNPRGRPWLPVLHAERSEWHFTAMYSNTPRAHDLGKTRDWVVIWFEDAAHHEGQHTVVTEYRGTLAGLRVVRGREAACRAHYDGLPREPVPSPF